jgi:hypothetical protein
MTALTDNPAAAAADDDPDPTSVSAGVRRVLERLRQPGAVAPRLAVLGTLPDGAPRFAWAVGDRHGSLEPVIRPWATGVAAGGEPVRRGDRPRQADA